MLLYQNIVISYPPDRSVMRLFGAMTWPFIITKLASGEKKKKKKNMQGDTSEQQRL